MDISNASREELIAEINSLRNDLQSLREESINEENIDFNDLIGDILSYTGFDFNSIILKFVSILLENIPNPAYFKDVNGKFEYVNYKFELFFGVSKAEIQGKSIEFLLNEDESLSEKEKDNEVVNTGKVLNYETVFTINGDTKDIIASKSAFLNLDESVLGVIGVLNDVSEKKRNERALVESEAKLKQANSAKDKFFSIISHDLKNPFVSLKGMIEILNDDIENLTRPEISAIVQMLRNDSEIIYSLLENLLHWSKSQRGKIDIDLSRFSFNEVVEEVFTLYRLLSSEKKIELILEKSDVDYICSDRNIISVIIRNLVNNSIKFNIENGKVSIGIAIISSGFQFWVSDTGIGLSNRDVKKLFDISEPHKSIGSNYNKGVGLGLILTSEFVNMLNGSIEVFSELNVGSKFVITLPFLDCKDAI